MASREVANLFVEFRGTFNKFQSDINHVTKTLGKFERDAKKVFGNINKLIAAGAALYGIQKIQTGLGELIKAGNELGDVTENFKKLGGTSGELTKAQDAILGVVSSVDLMKIANSGMLKGIPGFIENFSKISDLGNRVGDALGGDTKAGIQQVTDALTQALPKQLQQIGITIDLKKVYDDYAKSIGTTAEFLDKNQEKLARQRAAMEQLGAATEKLAAPGMSADSALSGLSAAITETIGSMGTIINDNEEFAASIKALADEIRKTDFSEFARILTELATGVMTGTVEAFKALKQAIEVATSAAEAAGEVFGMLFDNVFTDAVYNTMVDIGLATADLKEALKPPPSSYADAWRNVFGAFPGEFVNDNKMLAGFLQKLPTTSKPGEDETRRAEEARQRQAVKAEEDLAKLKEKNQKEADKAALDAIEEANKAYADGVATWRSLFENAITGVTFDLKDALKQVAVGFAADMAQGMLGSVGGLFGMTGAGVGSAQDLGGMLAQQLISSYFGTATTQAATTAATSTATTNATTAVTAGGTTAAGGTAAGVSMATMGTVALAALVAYMVGDFAGDVYRNPKQEYDKYGTGNATQAYGRYIAGYLTGGMSEAALSVMSSGVKSNPDTLSRLGVTGWIEEQLKGKNSMFYNKEGKLENFSGDIKTGGSDKFNTPGWGDQFMQQEGSKTFAAVGEGLVNLLGVTEDVGAQIGVILSENLNGNLDNARLLMQELGITQEQMTEQFVMMGESGAMSWHAVEVAIQDIAPAFGEGLIAAGDMVGAFDQIIASGGDGKDAIIAIKNSAIEAGEAGVKSFEEWKQALLAAGKDPEMVEAFFQALSARGLDTLEKIKEASTRTVGGVVADMQTISPVLAEQWIAAQQEAQEYIDTIAQIPDDSVKNITFNVDANISEDARAAMSMSGGGVDVSGVGDVPDTAAMEPPAARNLNGASARGTYFLDLRGAAPGVDSEVRRALKEIEGDIVVKAMNRTSAAAARGGSFGERFSE